MIKKKICLLGAFSVGKTSLVTRYVQHTFSEKYLTTVGVKVDKKSVSTDGNDVDLLIWDIHGEDDIHDISPSYLRGASGYLLVVDGTRHETLTVAGELDRRMRDMVGAVPFVVLLNKADRRDGWEIDDASLDELRRQGWNILETSAKTGAGVEEAFLSLARAMVTAPA